MKRNWFRLPAPILGITIIFAVRLIVSLNECRYLYVQKSEAFIREQDTSSFSYSICSILAKLFKMAMEVCFDVGVFYFSEAIKSLTNSDYEFCSLLVLARWVVYLPGNLIEIFLVDSSFGFNKMLFSEFMRQEFIENVIFLGCLYFIVFIFNFLTEKLSPLRGIAAASNAANFDFSSSSAGDKKLPPLRMVSDSPFQGLFVMLFFIVLVVLCIVFPFYNCCRVNYKELAEPSGKVKAAMSILGTEHDIHFDNLKIRQLSQRDMHLTIGFSNALQRSIIISDTMENTLSVEHLIAILVNQYYRANSQEGVLIIISYLIELTLFLYLVTTEIKKSMPEDMKLKDFVAYVIPISLTYFYCLDAVCGFFRNSIHNRFIYSADNFAVNFGAPIGEALIQVALNNKNAVMNTFLYSVFILEEPSLQKRLFYISNEKMLTM